MSSLSQEDLDAGWDGLEAEATAARDVTSAEAQALKSTPPNSMTIEKTPEPLESLVVPDVPSALNESDSSQSDAVSAMPLTNATEEATVSQEAHDPSVGTEVTATPSAAESSDAVSAMPLVNATEEATVSQEAHDPSVGMEVTATPSAAESSALVAPPAEVLTSEVESSLGSFQVVTDKPELFEVSHTSVQIESAPSPSVQSIDVPLLQARTTPVPGEPVTSDAEPVQGVPAMPEVVPVQAALVAMRTEPAQGAPVVQAAEPIRDALVVPPTGQVQVAPTAPDADQQSGEMVPASPAEPLRERTSTVGVVTRDLVASQAVARSEGAGTRWRRVRVMVWGAAALIGLGIGYMALHVGQANRHVAQPATVTNVESKAINAVQAPTHDLTPPSVAEVKAANDSVPAANTATRAAKAANADSASPRPQSESFSDAFVKHAATINSNWADVKKRPKVSDSNSSGRPAGAPAGNTSDNPLNVLDQLEKARKAKKQTANRP